MAKKGRKYQKASKAATIGWTALVLVLVVIGLFATGIFSVSDTAKDTKDEIVTDVGTVISASGCNIVPTISTTVLDEQNPGTAVTGLTTYYRVNGVYKGTTAPTFAKGDVVTMMISNSSWIDRILPDVTLECGANPVNAIISDYQEPGMAIYEDSTALSDGGGANNGSAIAAGSSETFELRLTGKNKDTSGDLIYVIEMSIPLNVSTITMFDQNGKALTEVDVPSFYVPTLTAPYTIAYKIPAIKVATEYRYPITVVAKDGKTIQGNVYTTAYVEEAYLESSTGKFEVGVELLDGTTAYESAFDFDVVLD